MFALPRRAKRVDIEVEEAEPVELDKASSSFPRSLSTLEMYSLPSLVWYRSSARAQRYTRCSRYIRDAESPGDLREMSENLGEERNSRTESSEIVCGDEDDDVDDDDDELVLLLLLLCRCVKMAIA